jgi:hypothetical protein
MARDPAFYVGYLGLPQRLRAFLGALLGLLLVFDLAMALLIFRAQPAPPTGAWGSEGAVAYRGTFAAKPYPLLRLPGRSILLVGEGKAGAPADLDALDGQLVKATGYPIRRGDLTVLQLDRLPVREDGVAPDLPALAPTGTRRLSGEVVDAKCFAGAMNPGDGKVHKGCGSFCLFGGIPALFVTRGPERSLKWYVLAAPDGAPIGPAAQSVVGDALTLTGRIVETDGLAVFEVDPAELAAP